MEGADNDDGIIRDYRDLKVWTLAMELAEKIYIATEQFPKSEAFGLTSQMRRSAVWIPSDIADGYGRQQRQSFIQYLPIAQGSLKALETQAELARRIGFLAEERAVNIMTMCERLGKMLRSFTVSLVKGK